MDREEQLEVLLKHIYSRYLMSWYSCSEGLKKGDKEVFIHYTELFPEVVKHWMLGDKLMNLMDKEWDKAVPDGDYSCKATRDVNGNWSFTKLEKGGKIDE